LIVIPEEGCYPMWIKLEIFRIKLQYEAIEV
jgi:hypothetical protein